MMTRKRLFQIREKLIKRRHEIVQVHQQLDDTLLLLPEPVVEFEEKAQKETLLVPLSELDEREKAEIEAIDEALRRMETGPYGVCDTCGGKITIRRLESLPWTTVCAGCAGSPEGSNASDMEEVATSAELPPDFQGMTDGELRESIVDELRVDGRVELDELEITCRKGIIHLGGFLPSEAKRQILLQILDDRMDLPTVNDEIVIDPLLWEREERADGRRPWVAEIVALREIEDQTRNPYRSSKEGIPMVPGDELIPEREG